VKTKWVIGVDEVGRGPLAGPVTVCAFAVRESDGKSYKGNFDSKKASAKDREELRHVCQALAKSGRVRFAISSVRAEVIDRIGITKSVRICITRVLRRLEIEPGNMEVLLDGGLRAPTEYKRQRTVIGGDRRVSLIGVSSMIAKVHRDKHMTRLALKFPQYAFDKHKGYGTRAHYAALKKHGLSPLHRKSFL